MAFTCSVQNGVSYPNWERKTMPLFAFREKKVKIKKPLTS